MTELEKIMSVEFAKRDDGKDMHIGTATTLGDGIQMASRVSEENLKTKRQLYVMHSNVV